MGYLIGGTEVECNDDGFLLEADYSDEAVEVIAAAENLELTPKHWEIINFMREEYRESGATPNFRNMLKAVNEFWPEADSKALYDLFPLGPAKQAAKVAGLPQPLGKGGY
jgi:tRNA 2-thiouridine synthesizing protein E